MSAYIVDIKTIITGVPFGLRPVATVINQSALNRRRIKSKKKQRFVLIVTIKFPSRQSSLL